MKSVQFLMKDIRDNDWFPDYEKVTALGQVNVLPSLPIYICIYIYIYIYVYTCMYIYIYIYI